MSFLLLKGQCRSCKERISISYFLVELWMGLIFLLPPLVYGVEGSSFVLICRDWFILWCLTYIFVYDYKYQEVLDRVTTIPAVMLFSASLYFGWMGMQDMLFGVLVGGGFFLIQFIVSKGRWVGGGDIRIGVLMGVILGLQKTVFALLFAYILGAIIGVFLLATKRKEVGNEIAFGTFLTIATLISLYIGEDIIVWYVQFLV